jgi:hypothetical protein
MGVPRSLRREVLAMAITMAGLAACSGVDYGSNPQPTEPPPGPQVTVVTATGAITAKVDEFRALLGDPSNGGTAGEQPTGRREISWDGAGANPFNNKNDFPAAFFNTNVKSGAVFTTPGTGFRNDSLRFGEVNSAYADQFSAFSPTKIFAPVGSNVMDVRFQVAGQPTPALVTGFGAVFSDVDLPGKSTLEFFDKSGQSLGVYAAPTRSDAAGLSFVGVKYSDPIVAFVRITLGTGALGANVNDISAGGTADLVVVDNFVYGEPKQSASLSLAPLANVASAGGLDAFGFNGIASGFPTGKVFLTGGGSFDVSTASNVVPTDTRAVASGGFRCIEGVAQGPLTGCADGEGVRWDTAQLLASTSFKCTAPEAVRPAVTGANTVVLLADFYRAGDGNDESFTAQMIVSTTDLDPNLPGDQTLWIQGVGCATAVVHFNR